VRARNITTEIEVRPVYDLNRIFEALDGANESGKRFVLDIAGTLASDVNTGRPTRLQPHVSHAETLKGVADAMIERLLPVRSDVENEEQDN